MQYTHAQNEDPGWESGQRSRTIGHRTRRGHWVNHIERITLEGPGAVRYRALCGGLQPYILVAHREPEGWGQFRADRANGWPDLAEELRRSFPCATCAERYDRQRGKALKTA
jgi:hypothetical protein